MAVSRRALRMMWDLTRRLLGALAYGVHVRPLLSRRAAALGKVAFPINTSTSASNPHPGQTQWPAFEMQCGG
jgi:hypothetical protein